MNPITLGTVRAYYPGATVRRKSLGQLGKVLCSCCNPEVSGFIVFWFHSFWFRAVYGLERLLLETRNSQLETMYLGFSPGTNN